MSRYIRRCPKCKDCLVLVVNEPPQLVLHCRFMGIVFPAAIESEIGG
jgi:hypothetical protein